jgi:hypothetical protein
VEDATTRQAISELNWASAASLDIVNLGSTVRLDEKPYQPLEEADEDDDKGHKENKGNGDPKTVSTSDLPNVNSNGIG